MDHLKDLIKKKKIEFVRFETEDFNGISNGFTLDVDHFINKEKQGIKYEIATNICTPTQSFPVTGTGVEVTSKNGYLYYDYDTYRVLPYIDDTASILVNLKDIPHDRESPSLTNFSTRALCKSFLRSLTDKGFRLVSAFEMEFYLIEEESKKFCQVYSTLDNQIFNNTMTSIMRSMKAMEIKPEFYHVGKGAPGKMEIQMAPAFNITSADNMFRYRTLVKEIARQDELTATFISKPWPKEQGSSAHFNHSLWTADGQNVFFNDDHPGELCDFGRYWLAGLQFHHKAIAALSLMSQNCFDRIFKTQHCASSNIWGYDQRVCYQVKTSEYNESTHIENRLPGAAANPYLVMSAHIIAGIDGIKNKMTPKHGPLSADAFDSNNNKEVNGIVQTPKNMEEALMALENNEVFVKYLGEDFVKCYTALKRLEVKEMEHLSPDEKHKYYMEKRLRYI